MLRVRASYAKHQQIAQIFPRQNCSTVGCDWLAIRRGVVAYYIADLPIWSKDGQKQELDLLMRYLRSTVDPPSWESQAIRAAYNAETLQLVVQATPEVHKRIAAALSWSLPDPVAADAASTIACIGPKAPTKLGAVIANEDFNKGLDQNVVRLHVWDWSKSDVSRLIQKSELGVLSPNGTTMLTYDGEALDLASLATRQYSGFRVNDDQVITISTGTSRTNHSSNCRVALKQQCLEKRSWAARGRNPSSCYRSKVRANGAWHAGPKLLTLGMNLLRFGIVKRRRASI
jgi:hypothetical protein